MCKDVLIVEDDALLSVVEKRMVEGLGHRVLASVKSGLQAIEKAREVNPDIILMDIFLQGELDGIETMKEIRKSSSVPVIYLSGSDDPHNHERAREISPVGFLTKPVKKYELKSCLDKAFVKS